jgi:hypothetical protein
MLQLGDHLDLDSIFGEAKALYNIRIGTINDTKKQLELLLTSTPSVNEFDAISKLQQALSKYRFIGNNTSAILGMHQPGSGFRVLN